MEKTLARMLRLMLGQMRYSFCLAALDGPIFMGKPDPTAQTPRGRVYPRGFPFFDFMCEIFHKHFGTPSRPHRGGKEGSACRVM